MRKWTIKFCMKGKEPDIEIVKAETAKKAVLALSSFYGKEFIFLKAYDNNLTEVDVRGW